PARHVDDRQSILSDGAPARDERPLRVRTPVALAGRLPVDPAALGLAARPPVAGDPAHRAYAPARARAAVAVRLLPVGVGPAGRLTGARLPGGPGGGGTHDPSAELRAGAPEPGAPSRAPPSAAGARHRLARSALSPSAVAARD